MEKLDDLIWAENPRFKAQRVYNEADIIQCEPSSYLGWDLKHAQNAVASHLIKNNVYGDIVELGCGHCTNSINFCKYFRRHDPKFRKNGKIYACDNFTGYTDADIEQSKDKLDPVVVQGLISNEGRWDIDGDDVKNQINNTLGLSGYIEIVEGDIHDTTKNLRPASGSISLLYVDCNAYGAAISGINNLKKYLSDGALVFIDTGFCPPAETLYGEHAALLEYSQTENLPMFRTFFGNFLSFFVVVSKHES